MRGKPTHTRRDRKGERITPAGAGKTSTNAAGKIVVGITPAGAGKTRTATASLFAETDHPRRCGENCQEFIHFCIFIGSPPQVRGKPGGGSGPGDTIGDHPRRCGENKSHGRERSARVGSPPQVRGKLWATAPVAACMRITPAGAGKTSATSFAIRGTWDHPRRCGENVLSLQFPKPPPWITPADAGKTSVNLKKAGAQADHPRGCGENYEQLVGGGETLGSPPRMRGKRCLHWLVFCGIRITPADAGKTSAT